MSLSSNFAWAPLAFVLLFLFAGSKYYHLWRTKTGNEGSRSSAKGKRLLTIQVPEVTSNESKVSHHVRDFSSADPSFPSRQKPTFQFDLEYCRRGATLWMSYKLNKKPCLYYMRLLLILRSTDTRRGDLKADTHEGFCSRSTLQGHAPGAKLLRVYQRFHGYTSSSGAEFPPHKMLHHI